MTPERALRMAFRLLTRIGLRRMSRGTKASPRTRQAMKAMRVARLFSRR